MKSKISILGISGSLRKGSFNSAALRFAKSQAPPKTHFEIFELEDIPSFNQDYETTPPSAIGFLKEKILASDAVLFATPEYNYSIPGVLKNAIDWASRPYGQSAWEGKPVAIMSASVGMLGGARAQYVLRQSFVFLNMYPLNRPEVMIPFAQEKFDEEGNITDKHTREKIKELVYSLIEWTYQIQEGLEVILPAPIEMSLYGTKGGKQIK